MSDYTKIVNYAAKDALVEGDPNKIIKGTELDAEFVAIQTAVATKSNLQSPVFTGIPRAPTAAFGTNTTQVATTAFVQENGVPVGGILMWSGLVANIPAGYHICDGTAGTPDLRGKFIIGAGGSYSPAATGGAATKTIETANLPAHTHGAGTLEVVANGGHNHTLTDPGHYHNSIGKNVMVGTSSGSGGATGDWFATATATTGISIAAVANHTHELTGTSGSTGSGTALDILPPYFALAYIMRTA